ncbi:hypothetical protein FO440_22570 [Mucilaginibacter corticis]|uniref:Uncharacterized protein n=1 Tax=Mucilaginibacter corticis TaxID=2597670 RepID=A0A556M9M3_9SPHI|nr:hypothetical protein [Mucilaginibacter corticis]TSJ36614.1 hypothetical protein FO440_22570 [Mucilaginibacter corticis]
MSPLKDKIDYLKNIYDEENARQPVLEGKCSQNIANSGIFLTLIGLLIGILSNTQSDLNVVVKCLLVAVIIAITVMNVFCIINALKALDPVNYPYARGNPNTVNEFSTTTAFEEEVVKDYIYCIEKNMLLNNKKASYLIASRKAYVSGIYLTGFFTIFLVCYLTFFMPATPEKIHKVEILKPVTLEMKSNALLQKAQGSK